jgi:hypothetical protein
MRSRRCLTCSLTQYSIKDINTIFHQMVGLIWIELMIYTNISRGYARFYAFSLYINNSNDNNISNLLTPRHPPHLQL